MWTLVTLKCQNSTKYVKPLLGHLEAMVQSTNTESVGCVSFWFCLWLMKILTSEIDWSSCIILLYFSLLNWSASLRVSVDCGTWRWRATCKFCLPKFEQQQDASQHGTVERSLTPSKFIFLETDICRGSHQKNSPCCLVLDSCPCWELHQELLWALLGSDLYF
jgi:hypothetical protein